MCFDLHSEVFDSTRSQHVVRLITEPLSCLVHFGSLFGTTSPIKQPPNSLLPPLIASAIQPWKVVVLCLVHNLGLYGKTGKVLYHNIQYNTY